MMADSLAELQVEHTKLGKFVLDSLFALFEAVLVFGKFLFLSI